MTYPYSAAFTYNVSDVAVPMMRALTEAETAAALQLLGEAAVQIRAAVPSVEARVEAGTLDPLIVKGVQVGMVLRVMRNPEGRRQEQESIGDYSYSVTRDDTTAAGALALTAADLALLTPRSTALPFGTIQLGRAL